MSARFDLTEDATYDLEEAVGSLARHSETAGLTLADNLEHAFQFLADWPSAGHRRQDLTNDERVRFWSAGGYLIAYLPTRSPLLILAVLHGARDAERLLTRRL